MASSYRSVCLLVLDGWGLASPNAGNAISLANTTNINRFMASYPHTQLRASGEAVGLPKGENGNTETGHLNIGAGRIVYQDLERINMAIADGTFFENKALNGAISHAIQSNSNLHLMGLVGAGGVHSSINHLYALLRLAREKNFKRVFLHLFTDGRDSPPTSSAIYIRQVSDVCKKEGVGTIASIMGRYWAMDRDKRWDRTAKAYFALTAGIGQIVKNPEEAIQASYAAGKTDEFIEPSLVSDANGKPVCLIKDNDAVIFINFRIDRPRQLSRAFAVKDFSKANVETSFDPYLVKYTRSHQKTDGQIPALAFERGEPLKNLYFATMTEYEKLLLENGVAVAYPPEIVEMPLGRVISLANLRQLRMSESEKERFVTFYFNGQHEEQFLSEERLIIPSPMVLTYDKKPEMAAREITDTLISKLKDGQYSFTLVNFANADMVAHTGSIGATATACRVIDECVGHIVNFALGYNITVLITADHGNAEEMINSQTGEIETEHNSNPVPFIAISSALTGRTQILSEGILADVAPTILRLLNLEVPTSMTGRNLLEGVFD